MQAALEPLPVEEPFDERPFELLGKLAGMQRETCYDAEQFQ